VSTILGSSPCAFAKNPLALFICEADSLAISPGFIIPAEAWMPVSFPAVFLNRPSLSGTWKEYISTLSAGIL
jgi:hypothetical protein